MKTPFFVKNKVLVSYKYTFLLLIIFGCFYWGPIVYESRFNILNSQYKILEDITLYFFPFLFFFIADINRRLSSGIDKYFLKDDNTLKTEERQNNLKIIIGGENFKFIKNKFETLTNRWIEIIFSICGIFFLGIGSYGLVWSIKNSHIQFEYLGLVVNNSIIISDIILLLIGTFFAIVAASGILYLLSFIIIIGNLKTFLKNYQKDNKIENVNIFQIYSIKKGQIENDRETMSYANFYSNFKEISDFITTITLELLMVGMIFSTVFILNELINFNKLNLTTISLLIILPLIIFCIFLYPQIAIFTILRTVKKEVRKGLNEKYFEYQKDFFNLMNEDETEDLGENNEKLEKLEKTLGILASIQENEEKIPTWPINIEIIIPMLVTILPSLIGFTFQLIK